MKKIVLCLLFAFLPALAPAVEPKIAWQPWSDTVFQKAKAENRFVLLDLGAVWCHWCHVMDEITYQDPEVIRLMGERYIAVRVDQDARPDLSNRYEDYGWPATIIFAPDGSELAKRRGYLPPKMMSSLLQAIIDDPTPGPSVQPEKSITFSEENALTDAQRTAMNERLNAAYDDARGGWGDTHKFLNWDALEYTFTQAKAGNEKAGKMTRQTLDAGLKLVDPVWGGVYQYSTDGDWDHPHFEKIMPYQAENLRVLSQAYAYWNEPSYLDAAQKIRAYLRNFLTDKGGAFYTSQDADVVAGEHSAGYFNLDDAGRRKQGIPRIDTHIYSRENGLAITGLAELYAVTGEAACLEEARRAADWIIANRSLPKGGFRHDSHDSAGPYLADNLSMGRAFLQLYTVTAERVWLERAEKVETFIVARFKANPGYATAAVVKSAPLRPKQQTDENHAFARFAGLLSHYTGKAKYLEDARHAMRYLATPAIIEDRGFGVSGILLADLELSSTPLHITVLGSKKDPLAQSLFAAALHDAVGYRQIEWLDRREGPLPGGKIPFPDLPTAAAFICTQDSCSAPINSVESLHRKLQKK